MENKRDTVICTSRINLDMLEIGFKINVMEKEFIMSRMEILMKEILKMILKMGQVPTDSLMERNFRVLF